MDIAPINAIATPAAASFRGMPEEPAQLRETCREFEGVMAAAIFKEGLRSAFQTFKEDGEGDDGSQTFMEIAIDQLANHLGRQGMLGIADMVGHEMTRSLQEDHHGDQ